MKLIVI